MNRQHVAANVAVQVTNATHARAGQAGVTQEATGVYNAPPESQAETVTVKFDVGGEEAVAVADLDRL